MFGPFVASEMHREREGAMALGTRQGTGSVTASLERLTSLERRALRIRKREHATDRFFAIYGNALSRNARQTRLLAFLSGELR